MQRLKSFLPILLTLGIGLIGVFVLRFINAPMPWLLGSILAIMVASRFKSISIASPKYFSAPSRAILGITIGSAFRPEILNYLGDFVSSLVLIIPFVFLTTACGMWYYVKILKFDKITAYFSAIPGGLLEMATLAESFSLNLYKVVITQSSRLLFMIFLLPFVLEYFLHISLDARRGITQPLMQTNLMDMFLIAVLAFVGWKGALKLKIPGGTLIGPMVIGALAYSFDILHSRPPSELLNIIQLILGSSIGFVFVGISYKEIFKVLSQTLGYFVILIAICSLFMTSVWWMTDFPLLSIMLAFAPGGQAEMNLIAIVVGANLPYVALHHIVRLFLVIGIAPILVRLVKKNK